MTDETPQPDLIEVRSTVNLSRLPVGTTATVDRSDPEIADLLRHQLLVPLVQEQA